MFQKLQYMLFYEHESVFIHYWIEECMNFQILLSYKALKCLKTRRAYSRLEEHTQFFDIPKFFYFLVAVRHTLHFY